MAKRQRRSRFRYIFALALVITVAVMLVSALMKQRVYEPATDPAEIPVVSSTGEATVAHPDATTPAVSPETAPREYRIVSLTNKDCAEGSLILVNSKNNFEIPEDIDIVNLKELRSDLFLVFDDNAALHNSIIEPLNNMLRDFKTATGRSNVVIYSSYRTYERQKEIFKARESIYGYTEALKWASEPGYSEHHTGLAVDFAIYEDDYIQTFTGEGDYGWIVKNAYKYGFILRYESDKTEITGTNYEPWHYRYVGVPHAYFMQRRGYCFEEYMKYLSAFQFGGVHFTGEYDGSFYEVYYVEGTEVPVPVDAEYTISGTNLGGFIVTVKRISG